MQTFTELKVWLDGLPDQILGCAASVSDAGEPYQEFLEYAIARPDDVSMVEEVVAELMHLRLDRYFKDRRGRIYWRVRLETVTEPHARIVRFDDGGPDIDFVTNRKCIKDNNWRKVGCYCRMYRARLPTPEGKPLHAAFANLEEV